MHIPRLIRKPDCPRACRYQPACAWLVTQLFSCSERCWPCCTVCYSFGRPDQGNIAASSSLIVKHCPLHCSPLLALLTSVSIFEGALCNGTAAWSCSRAWFLLLALLIIVSFVLGAPCNGVAGCSFSTGGFLLLALPMVTFSIECSPQFPVWLPPQAASDACRSTLALLTSVSFILGAVCSGMAGYVGMWVSVRANVRVAGGARRSAREALQIALRAGGFSGLVVVGMVSWADCQGQHRECQVAGDFSPADGWR